MVWNLRIKEYLFMLPSCHKLTERIFIIKGFRTIVFIFIVISTTFQPICPPAFFRCLSNSGTFTELRTTSYIETSGVAGSDSVSYNRVQVLSISVVSKKRKALFSIATTPKCREGHYSFPWIAPLYPWYIPYNSEC